MTTIVFFVLFGRIAFAAYVKIREWKIGIWPSGNKTYESSRAKYLIKNFLSCPNKIMSMGAERR